MLTRIFQSGNSQAVRIPKELAFAAGLQDVEVVRKGDGLLIRAVSRESLAGAMKAFAAFPPGFMSEGRANNEQAPRAWGSLSPVKSSGKSKAKKMVR